MDIESVRQRFNRDPKQFDRIEVNEPDYNTNSTELRAAEIQPLAERFRQFGELASRVRTLAAQRDIFTGNLIDHTNTDMRVYEFSIAFDEFVETPFLILSAYYSPNPEEPTQELRSVTEYVQSAGNEMPVKIVAQWWPPQAISSENWSFAKPSISEKGDDYIVYVGEPVAQESIDITQLGDTKESQEMLALLESSILEAEKRHGKNIVFRAKDIERFRILDRISPIIGTYTVTGRWHFDDSIINDDEFVTGLDTPFKGISFPIRGIVDNESGESVDLEPGKEHKLDELANSPILTVADIILSLALVGKHEFTTRFSSPFQDDTYDSDFGRLPDADKLYTIGVPKEDTWIEHLSGNVRIFPAPIGSGQYYDPKLKAQELPLLTPLDRDIDYDPSGGMLSIPPDAEW